MQNLWDTAKVVLRGMLIAIQAYLRKQKTQINNLTLHLKQLEKEEPLLGLSPEKMRIKKSQAGKPVRQIGRAHV